MKFLPKKRTIATVLIAVFIAQLVLLIPNTSKVHAVVPVIDRSNLIVNTRTAANTQTTAVNTGSLVTKEYILDEIAYVAKSVLVRALTTSIVNWINSGFDGGPAFITDFGGFLSDIVDEELGRFIEGSALSFLCEPYSLNIRIALTLRTNAPFKERISCTFSDVIDNLDGFIGGDFSQGGWAGWFDLTTKPQNNIYGSYIMAEKELDLRIAAEQYREKTQLDWGRGFLSYEDCEELPEGFVGPPRCEIITPGSVIEEQLEKVLGTNLAHLELADELNEILIALLNQLMQKAFGGSGLRGIGF